MKFLKTITGAVAGLTLAMSAQLANATSSFANVGGNGVTVGTMAKNASASLTDSGSIIEAILYLASICFLAALIFGLVKWKKSDGREGNPGLLAVYFIAAVCSAGAPTLLGGGLTTFFGTGTTVTTVKAPTASFTN